MQPPALALNGNRIDFEVGKVTLRQLEAVTIENTLRVFQGCRKQAAHALGISRMALYNKIKRYQLRV